MKKILGILAGALFLMSLTACDVSSILGQKPTSQNSELSSQEEVSKDSSSKESSVEDSSENSSVEEKHPHNLNRVAAKSATCAVQGNILHWYCETCDTYFADVNGQEEISYAETLTPFADHVLVTLMGKEATCDSAGRHTGYYCSKCTNIFLDSECTQSCTQDDLVIAPLPHDLTHHEAIPVVETTNGVIEHWTCNDCGNFFRDVEGKQQISEAETVWYALGNLVDFVVEVPEGRDPVVLQLTDTQIIDAGQTRPGRDGVDYNFWATDKREERCYQYVRETIEATDPDFIILTGDIIYGEFDDNGSVWLDFIAFMESFQIPWAPIFGNHDNESAMGVDWQCQQLENAEYCVFEQKTLTGNGNYSVGIVQGDELKRTFYMLDSNGCGNASEATKNNGHTAWNYVGFKQDQINWYTEQIRIINAQSPDPKISFAYHIQQNVFGEAYAKYGFDQNQKYQDIHIDLLKDKTEGDFGYIGRQMKGPWDTDNAIFNGMKALGVDSIFVGHEHCNSASVVYEGVRFQYGQKSSEYDRFNSVDAGGTITGDYLPHGTSLIGGSVIVLSETDGSIKDAYIYYCENAGGNIDWSQFIPYDVNGLQKTDFTLEAGITLIGRPFDDTVNAYMVTANSQGKVLIDTALMRGKTTFTFTVYIEDGYNELAGMGPYAIRLKPDDGSASGIAGVLNASGKYYIDYDVDSVDEVRIQTGVWQTFTVDISTISETCTEFAFIIAQGNTMYLRDMMFS